MEALQTLLATAQLSEVVGCATWPQIKNGLQASLLDISGDKIQQEEGMKISTLALKVYVRLIGTPTENNGPFATREGFCGLTEFLTTLYKGLCDELSFPNFGEHIHSNIKRIFGFYKLIYSTL